MANDRKNIDNTEAENLKPERIEDEFHEELDTTNPEALKEAARLGTTDAYFVKTDFEDADEREDEDQPDGRPSPMANADNPER